MSDEKVRQKHKHYDCIVAWAEGKEIEYYSELTKKWAPVPEPFWSETTNYRIKPEPKPDIVGYTVAKIEYEDTVEIEGFANFYTENDNLKLTFDGETHKLKKAELLDMETTND